MTSDIEAEYKAWISSGAKEESLIDAEFHSGWVAGMEHVQRELEARELHHFETEKKLEQLRDHILAAAGYADELDHFELLEMIGEI